MLKENAFVVAVVCDDGGRQEKAALTLRGDPGEIHTRRTGYSGRTVDGA